MHANSQYLCAIFAQRKVVIGVKVKHCDDYVSPKLRKTDIEIERRDGDLLPSFCGVLRIIG